MDKQYKAYSIITDWRSNQSVRVDWRCYERLVGRVAGLLTRQELDWLESHLRDTHKIEVRYEELSSPFDADPWDYDDIELTPVKLIQYSDISFANQIIGYIVSYPLNVGSVDEFLKLTLNQE